jgi:uncharacterized Zn finger protein
MAKKYGKTFWGAEFLNAFKDIDESNRLPRGATYANKGCATGIKIKDNRISADVQGSSWEPYRVKVEFEDFGQIGSKQRVALEKVLQNQGPLFLSKILNQELPQSLLDALRAERVWIFPRNWSMVKARCNRNGLVRARWSETQTRKQNLGAHIQMIQIVQYV